jgi:protein O-GlcNAc transferase
MLLGVIKGELKQYAAAIALLKKAVVLSPESSAAHYNLGRALLDTDEPKLALQHLTRSIELEPDRAESFNSLGNAFFALGRNQQAVDSYKRAIEFDPKCPGVAFNLGVALRRLFRWQEAVNALQLAVRQHPGDYEAHHQLGVALCEGGQFHIAVKAFAHVFASSPFNGAAASFLVYAKRQMADWDDLGELEDAVERLVDSTTSGGEHVNPFPLAAISDDPALILRCTKRVAARPARKVADNLFSRRKKNGDERPIKIAYVSGDYREHATSYLIAELIERHDRRRFEVHGISFGPAEDSPMSRRMAAAFDVFLDVQDQSPEATAELMRQHEIDIAIDLVGFNQHGRMGIFANRAAPVQVNYLGWPATTGAPYMDYILADATVVPEDKFRHYAEAVVHLPECY